jgi:hypothetical protein
MDTSGSSTTEGGEPGDFTASGDTITGSISVLPPVYTRGDATDQEPTANERGRVQKQTQSSDSVVEAAALALCGAGSFEGVPDSGVRTRRPVDLCDAVPGTLVEPHLALLVVVVKECIQPYVLRPEHCVPDYCLKTGARSVTVWGCHMCIDVSSLVTVLANASVCYNLQKTMRVSAEQPEEEGRHARLCVSWKEPEADAPSCVVTAGPSHPKTATGGGGGSGDEVVVSLAALLRSYGIGFSRPWTATRYISNARLSMCVRYGWFLRLENPHTHQSGVSLAIDTHTRRLSVRFSDDSNITLSLP